MNRQAMKALACCALLALAGCAGSRVEPERYSGFLRDYSRLKPALSATGAPVMRWIADDLEATSYTRLYIEASQYYPKPQPTAVVSAQTLDSISRYYDTALKRELGKDFELVQSPGPGTLTVRPAITAVETRPEGMHAYEILPVALVASALNAAAGGRDQSVEIATELAVLDSATGKVLAQLVRKGTGESLETSSSALTLENVKPVLDGWASDMRMGYQSMRTRVGSAGP